MTDGCRNNDDQRAYDGLLAAAWRAKAAPDCDEPCEAHKPNGLCTCGRLSQRHADLRDFRRLATPDVVIELAGTALWHLECGATVQENLRLVLQRIASLEAEQRQLGLDAERSHQRHRARSGRAASDDEGWERGDPTQ